MIDRFENSGINVEGTSCRVEGNFIGTDPSGTKNRSTASLGVGVGGLAGTNTIDLDSEGPTPNDPGDPDTGTNNLQNFPFISAAKKTASGKMVVKGKLNSNPNETFTVQFFSNPKGTNEGKKLLFSRTISTDDSGNVSFTFSTTKAVNLGQNITATATKNSTGDTSEFSAPRKVVAS